MGDNRNICRNFVMKHTQSWNCVINGGEFFSLLSPFDLTFISVYMAVANMNGVLQQLKLAVSKGPNKIGVSLLSTLDRFF
jgi:hypothetical protein